jgi:hypothetical protein
MDRIELDARTARCAEHLDREGVLGAHHRGSAGIPLR